MARAKKDKKVVVNQAYFELIERKSEIYDEIFTDDGQALITVDAIKAANKINLAWAKVDAGELSGSEAYEEPAE